MSVIGNLKTRTKLLLAFGLVCAIMAGLGLFAIRQLGTVNDKSTEIADNWLPSVKHTSDLNTQTSDTRAAELEHVLSATPENMAKYERDLSALGDAMKKTQAAYEPLIASPEERQGYERFRASWSQYLQEQAQILRLSRQNQTDEAKARLRGESQRLFDEASGQLAELAALNQAGATKASGEGDQVYASARWLIIAVLLASVVAAVSIAVFIAGVISKPLTGAVEVLRAVADGDCTRRLAIDTRDEVGQMAGALNLAVGSVRQALEEVRSVADTVASASAQLASASQEIASGAQEQASSLEETAASLEEITSTVKQNADNAGQANQLANGSREAADKGGAVVGEAVEAMAEINRSSKKIADIITTIDEIAFQTNLLALNAAVEAARAGEQGRGFAVVAAEVRNLAQRSASAAKEIKTLIQDSVRKVEAGSELVNRSGTTLHEIVTSVKRVTDIVAEIAAASREQTSGIEQVNKAVTQMDQVTQQNASQTEELSGTAESLSGQAEQLQQLVARFKLDGGEGRRHAASPSH